MPDDTAGRENLDNLIFVVNCNYRDWMVRFEETVKLFKNLRVISEAQDGMSSRLFGVDTGTSY